MYINFKTKDGIKEWIEYYCIHDYEITDDLTVIVENLNLCGMNLKQLPPIKFVVKRNMVLFNSNLRSLINCPEEIPEDFDCSANYLTSLKHGPKKVGGNFACRGNRLVDLIGGPSFVGKEYCCDKNKLTSLEGIASTVKFLDCTKNRLKNLTHLPMITDKVFIDVYLKDDIEYKKHLIQQKLG